MDYLEGFTTYFEFITDNPLAIAGVIVALLIVVFIYFVTTRLKKGTEKNKRLTPSMIDSNAPETPLNQITLGNGVNKCAAIRDAKKMHRPRGTNIIDITTISEPVGECHLSEPTMPVTGDLYTVKEAPDGTISDYEEYRQTTIDAEKTPQKAFWAIEWKEMTDAIGSQVKWYANQNLWLVVGCIVVLFFIAMMSLDYR